MEVIKMSLSIHTARHLLRIAAFTATISLTGVAQAEDFSTGSVALGTNFAAVKQQLTQGFDVYDVPSGDTHLQVFVGVRKDQKEQYVVEGINNKVFYVAHHEKYDSGQQPLATAVVGALGTKYGTTITAPGSELRFAAGGVNNNAWIFDSADHVLTGIEHGHYLPNDVMRMMDDCLGVARTGQNINVRNAQGQLVVTPAPVVVASAADQRCHRMIAAGFATEQQNPQLVTMYWATVEDNQPYYGYLKQKQDTAQAAQNAKLQAAKANTPKL
jgi:hypothetical protein